MKKYSRITTWILLNGAFAALTIYGIQGNVGASRLIAFTAGFCAAVYWFTALNTELTNEARKRGRPVPAWLANSVDSAMIVLFVWNGWFAVAIAWLLTSIAEGFIYSDKKGDAK